MDGFVLWIIASIFAYFIKGLCGFANTLIFTSILNFCVNNIDISPVDLLIGYPSNMIMVFRERKSLKWKICLPVAALVLLGNIPGMLLLRYMDPTIIKVIFGFVIVLLGVEMLLREFNLLKFNAPKWLLTVVGVLSGILSGLYGVGALLSAYMSRVTDDIHSFKANMCFVFAVDSTFRMILYIVSGIITFSALKKAAILFPFVLSSMFLGMFLTKKLKESIVKKIVIILLILSGIALVITSLT